MLIELDLTQREAEKLRDATSIPRHSHPDERSAVIKLSDALDKALRPARP
jgi:hypothetical protein